MLPAVLSYQDSPFPALMVLMVGIIVINTSLTDRYLITILRRGEGGVFVLFRISFYCTMNAYAFVHLEDVSPHDRLDFTSTVILSSFLRCRPYIPPPDFCFGLDS